MYKDPFICLLLDMKLQKSLFTKCFQLQHYTLSLSYQVCNGEVKKIIEKNDFFAVFVSNDIVTLTQHI